MKTLSIQIGILLTHFLIIYYYNIQNKHYFENVENEIRERNKATNQVNILLNSLDKELSEYNPKLDSLLKVYKPLKN